VKRKFVLGKCNLAEPFLLEEISNEPNVEPNLKIFIEPKEQSGIDMDAFPRDFVPASEVGS